MAYSALKPLALTAALMALSGAAHATTVLIHPVGATASTSFPGYPAADAIDSAPNTDWASQGQGNHASLILDLGSLQTLTEANVTDRVTSGGANGSFAGGTTDFTTEFSLTPCADASCSSFSGPAQDFTHAVPVNPTSAADFEISVALNPFTTQYVEYNVVQNVPSSTNNTGLSDISFLASVPEPATWAMLLLGVAGIGAGLRGSRRQLLRATVA